MAKKKVFNSTLKWTLGGVLLFFFLTPLPVWAVIPNGGNGGGCIPDPIPSDFRVDAAIICMLGRLITPLFALVPAVATILLIYGGFRYATSAGDPRAMESTKKFLTWVIIGSILALGAIFIIRLLTSIIGGKE